MQVIHCYSNFFLNHLLGSQTLYYLFFTIIISISKEGRRSTQEPFLVDTVQVTRNTLLHSLITLHLHFFTTIVSRRKDRRTRLPKHFLVNRLTTLHIPTGIFLYVSTQLVRINTEHIFSRHGPGVAWVPIAAVCCSCKSSLAPPRPLYTLAGRILVFHWWVLTTTPRPQRSQISLVLD